jgi:hypothetical protein
MSIYKVKQLISGMLIFDWSFLAHARSFNPVVPVDFLETVLSNDVVYEALVLEGKKATFFSLLIHPKEFTATVNLTIIKSYEV